MACLPNKELLTSQAATFKFTETEHLTNMDCKKKETGTQYTDLTLLTPM